MRVLPSLENILYGANLSNILSVHKHTLLDVLAWFPYGIGHFGAPIFCSILLFAYGPPGTLPVFARTFGYMNLIGVMIQIIFPCSAPWYEDINGFAPANYNMSGSPAGLAAIDDLFGVDMYTSKFTASPLVFGAFPSLHAACASLEALFMSHVFPRFRPFFILYILWICWATMYLSHHYAVDLVGGSIRTYETLKVATIDADNSSVAASSFFVANARYLPRLQRNKAFRWDYDFVDLGDQNDQVTTNYRLTHQDDPPNIDSDEWTIGSSTVYSYGAKSPSTETRSPSDENYSLWEDTEPSLTALQK